MTIINLKKLNKYLALYIFISVLVFILIPIIYSIPSFKVPRKNSFRAESEDNKKQNHYFEIQIHIDKFDVEEMFIDGQINIVGKRENDPKENCYNLRLIGDSNYITFNQDSTKSLVDVDIDENGSGFHYEGRLAKLNSSLQNNIGNFPFDTYPWDFHCSFQGWAFEAGLDAAYNLRDEILKSEPLITIETDIPEWEFNIMPESPRHNGSSNLGFDLAFYIEIARISMFKIFPLIIYLLISLFALLSLILAILVAIEKLISNIPSILFSISTVLFSLITIRNQFPIMTQKTSRWDLMSIYISIPIIIISILFVLGYIIWNRSNNK